ncbi:Fc.00g035530.m01.CDS01 [Cosmosporella sp. VM-42]
MVGATCDYNTRLIRWSTRTTVSVPAMYQVTSRDEQLSASLAVYEKRALDYFHSRVWPLLSTASQPCAPPTLVALEHRVVLLATCVLADSHRLLQDGRNSRQGLNIKRLECLAAVRVEVDGCCNSDDGPLRTLLFAVLLLHFHDGFLECTQKSASTASHHSGVLAILDRLGGMQTVLSTCPESLHMLLSEFASADLTTAMLQGRPPSFPPHIWDIIDKGSVWWGRDPLGRCSLATVFQEISSMAFYLEAITNMYEEFSMDRIRMFEAALRPVYAPLTVEDIESPVDSKEPLGERELEAVQAFTLIRAFQHTALVYLYRAICGLPTLHPLVQQHVQSCLDCIFEIKRPSKVLNCIIFPLCVAGAHAQSARHQRAVLNMVNLIYDEMRFGSVHSVNTALSTIWKSETQDMTWSELFAELSPHALVL